jgi:glutathione S-transferase
MALQLWFHPLSSFCWKALIALYETDTPFEPKMVDFADPASVAAFKAVWPIGKMPVAVDPAEDRTVPESSIIIEYLDRGSGALIPKDLELARQTRLKDRFYDQYLHQPMQKVVGDRLRPEGAKDPFGVEQARAQIRAAYEMADQDMAGRTWAMGEAFTLADCSAFPATFYADRVEPMGPDRPALAAYVERLKQRPSVARTLREAEPYFHMFPG